MVGLDRGHDNRYTRRDLVNGSFQESFDALITSNGTAVTMTLTNPAGDNFLSMQFSDIISQLDVSSLTIDLTPGTDNTPQENYIFIPQSTKVLTKSISGFPTDEHIKIGFFFSSSATKVQTKGGTLINQNWNDHLKNGNNMGHMLHLSEQARYQKGYFKGVDANGTDQNANTSYFNYIGAAESYYKATSGIMYQLHRHTLPAFDTQNGDDIQVINWSGDLYHEINNIADIKADSTGTSLANKYFNVFFFEVGNKTGEYSPIMAMLPDGSYVSQASAENDVDLFDNLIMPRQFSLDSSVGVPVCRMTLRWSGGFTTLSHISTVDLRIKVPSGGGGGSSVVEFADNQFAVFDEADITKILNLDVGSLVSTGNTRTLQVPDSDGIIFLANGNEQMTGNIDFAAADNEVVWNGTGHGSKIVVQGGTNTFMDFEIGTSTGAEDALYRIFRNTTTSGSREFRIFKGDGTGTRTFVINADTGEITSGTLTSDKVSDFGEAVDDQVNTLLVGGTNVNLVYDDVANTLTINSPFQISPNWSTVLISGRSSVGTGLVNPLIAANDNLEFRDGQIFITSPSDGNLTIDSDGGILVNPANTLTIGDGTAGVDYAIVFDGQTNDGTFRWMEDEDHFRFDNSIYFNTTAECLTVALPTNGNRTCGFRVNAGSDPGLYFQRVTSGTGDITMENAANIYHQFGVLGSGRIGDVLHTNLTNAMNYDAQLNTLTLSNGVGAFASPQMTTTQRNAMTPANGWIIYNTTTNQMEGYINGAWAAM